MQHPASLSDKCSRTDLLLVGPCIEMFEDSLHWQTERVFRFVCTVGKRLQAPDLPFYFYSESSPRPFVSPVEWARSSKLQAFSFTSTAGQRLQAAGLPFHLCRGPEAPGSRPTVSVKVQFCSGQSSRLPGPRPHRFTNTEVQVSTQQHASGRETKVCSFRCAFR